MSAPGLSQRIVWPGGNVFGCCVCEEWSVCFKACIRRGRSGGNTYSTHGMEEFIGITDGTLNQAACQRLLSFIERRVEHCVGPLIISFCVRHQITL